MGYNDNIHLCKCLLPQDPIGISKSADLSWCISILLISANIIATLKLINTDQLYWNSSDLCNSQNQLWKHC